MLITITISNDNNQHKNDNNNNCYNLKVTGTLAFDLTST